MRNYIRLIERAASQKDEMRIWFDCMNAVQKYELKLRTSRYHDSDKEREDRAITFIANNIAKFKSIFDSDDLDQVKEKWAAYLEELGPTVKDHTQLTQRQSTPDTRQITRNIARGE